MSARVLPLLARRAGRLARAITTEDARVLIDDAGASVSLAPMRNFDTGEWLWVAFASVDGQPQLAGRGRTPTAAVDELLREMAREKM